MLPTGYADAAFSFRSHRALVAYVNGNSSQKSQMYKLQLYICGAASASRRLLIIKVQIRSLQSPCGMFCGTKVLLRVPLLYSVGYESAGLDCASL